MEIIKVYDEFTHFDCRSCDCGLSTFYINAELLICKKCDHYNIFCRIKYNKSYCIKYKNEDEMFDKLIEIDSLENWKNEINNLLSNDIATEIINNINEKLKS